MILPQVLIGSPLEFYGIAKVYPPTVRQSLEFYGFDSLLALVTLSQEDIWDKINEEESGKKIYDFRLHDKENTYKQDKSAPTPLDKLMEFAAHGGEALKTIQDFFYLLTREKVRIIPGPKVIIFSDDLTEIKDIAQARMITPELYFQFQNVVRQAIGKSVVEPPDPNEPAQVALIKAKARARDKIKNKQQKGGSISYSTTLLSLCCTGSGINPLNIGEIPYASVSVLSRMNTQKDIYNSDVAIRSNAFAKVKGELKYWVRDFEK